jgi:ribonuclease-3
VNILTHFKEIFEQNYFGQWSNFQKIGRKIQNIIHYDFVNEETLWNAMFIRGSRLPSEEFERLEFLGDSILKAIHGILLYERGEEFQPGKLTVFRQNLESNDELAPLAEELKFNEIGSLLEIGELSPKQAAEFFEALIGAIYVDKGSIDAMITLVKGITHFQKRLKELQKAPWESKDPKSFLHEWVLKKYGDEASVDFLSVSEGTSDPPQFKVRVIIKRKTNDNIEIEGPWVVGTFSTKKEGEKEAAKALLSQLEEGKLDSSS